MALRGSSWNERRISGTRWDDDAIQMFRLMAHRITKDAAVPVPEVLEILQELQEARTAWFGERETVNYLHDEMRRYEGWIETVTGQKCLSPVKLETELPAKNYTSRNALLADYLSSSTENGTSLTAEES